MWGLGSGVWDWRSEIRGLRPGLGFEVWDLGSGIWGLGFGIGVWVGAWGSGLEFGSWGLGLVASFVTPDAEGGGLLVATDSCYC